MMKSDKFVFNKLLSGDGYPGNKIKAYFAEEMEL